MSEEDTRYPHESAINKAKHKIDGLLRGLDLNNVVIEKRSRNNSESSHSVSGEAASKKKSNTTSSDTSKTTKHRKSSNQIYLAKVIEEQEDSQEDNSKANHQKNSKEAKVKNSTEDLNSQRRKLRSAEIEKQDEIPNIKSKKHQKINTKVAYHTEKIMNQKVQQEQTTFNLNNSNEEGLSSTSCSSDLLKKTKNKSSHEHEALYSHQNTTHLLACSLKGEKQVEKKRKTSDSQKVEPLVQYSRTVSREKRKSFQNKKEEVQLQSQKQSKDKGTESREENFGKQTHPRQLSNESVRKYSSEDNTHSQKKETHKKQNLSSTSQKNQSQRDLRASKREIFKNQELQELQELEKISSEQKQIKQTDQLKTSNKQDNKSENQASKITDAINNSKQHDYKKQVSFKEKLSEIIGEEAESAPVKGSFISVYDYNVHQESDSEKDYFPSKKAFKNHKKEKRIKKRQENKLEIAIKKTQKLLQTKNLQMKQQRTIISVELPSESSLEDDDDELIGLNQKTSELKNEKVAFFSKKLNDLDKTNSYKSKREKVIQENCSNFSKQEGEKNHQILESQENRNGKNKSNDALFSSIQNKNIKSVSSEASSQKNLNSNRQINSQGVLSEAQIQNSETTQKNQNAYGKNKHSESKAGNSSLEIQSQQKNLKAQQIHCTSQQVKAEIEFKDKQIKKKQSSTKNLQNQMNLKDQQFQSTNNFNSEIGITHRENNSDQKETKSNLEQKKLNHLNNLDTPLEDSPISLCSSSSLLVIEEDKQIKDVNNDPHTLSQDQTSQLPNQRESSKIKLATKSAHQYGQLKLQNGQNSLEQEEDSQDNLVLNPQHVKGAEQDITCQVEVNQTQQKNILSQQRQIQNENRKRDISCPLFYDPKIEFINTNIFFKNFYTEFQPQERKTFYQKVAYQHHLLTSQHTASQQTQSIVVGNQKTEKNNQTLADSQQNEQQKEEQQLQLEIQEGEKLLSKELSIEQNYQNHSNNLINIGQNKNFVEKSNRQENLQNINQMNNKDLKDSMNDQMQIEEQELCQLAEQNSTENQGELNQQLIKKHIGILTVKNKESGENMIYLQSELDLLYEKYYPSQTYINCDLKYFNLELIIQNTGLFDIIYMDPPWRIKGGQQFDSQFMFSNSKFSLDYDTMSNKEIMDIPVEKLSNKGFLFLWILNTQMNTAIQMMQKWGYNLVDKIVWVKMKDKNVYLSHGYYFMHSFELCLIGYKNDGKDDLTSIYPASSPFSVIDENISEENKSKGGNKKSEINLEYPHFFNKISNNVIFAEVRKKSQKPDEIYEIIDLIIPGAKKIELFARNNNLRPGWVSVGNQLGETYEKWMHQVNCDNCHQEIVKGKLKRYKSRRINNYDICENCVQKFDKKDFYEIQNKVNEDILHNYQSCNRCEAEPIWGIRFHCMVCKDFDLCEACVDENTKIHEEEQFHNLQHDMKIIEVPVFADGFPVHDRKCQSCFMSPIIGTCFTCKQCQGNFNLCQNCYFSKPIETIKNKRHRPEHQMDALISPVKNTKTKKIQFKCAGCGVLNLKDMYKCENCYGFYFCLLCYETKRDDFKTYMASSHKNYHQLVRYNLEEIESQNEQKFEFQNAQASQINNDPINSQLILNVISNILETNEIKKPQNADALSEEGSHEQLKEQNKQEIELEDDNVLKKQTEIQEYTENINQDIKQKKNGKAKRSYNRKQKVQQQEDKDKDEASEDQKNLKQIEQQNDEQKGQLTVEIDQSENKKMDQQKEIQDDTEKTEEQNLKSNLVKKIRKKRVSKKQKQQLEDQSEEKKEENNDQLIVKKSDSINNCNKSVEESNQNQMEEEEDQKDESNKSEEGIQENEVKGEEKVAKKRKRRTKQEIEKFRQEKEQKNLEYLIGLHDGKEKKKRGRLPKLKDNTKLQSLLNSQLEQNQQQKQSEENSFLQINQSNINEQFFDKQSCEYNQRLMQDQLFLETLSNQPQQIVAELQQKLKLLESFQQQKQLACENENNKYNNNNNNDLYFLSDINQASDFKENTLNIQIQNQLNQNKISNFNYSNQEDQPFQNPFNYDLLQNLLNSINRNSIQQSNHSYNEENTIQYNNSVEKGSKENQQIENLINQTNQGQINLDDKNEDVNDDESYDSASSSG